MTSMSSPGAIKPLRTLVSVCTTQSVTLVRTFQVTSDMQALWLGACVPSQSDLSGTLLLILRFPNNQLREASRGWCRNVEQSPTCGVMRQRFLQVIPTLWSVVVLLRMPMPATGDIHVKTAHTCSVQGKCPKAAAPAQLPFTADSSCYRSAVVCQHRD